MKKFTKKVSKRVRKFVNERLREYLKKYDLDYTNKFPPITVQNKETVKLNAQKIITNQMFNCAGVDRKYLVECSKQELIYALSHMPEFKDEITFEENDTIGDYTIKASIEIVKKKY